MKTIILLLALGCGSAAAATQDIRNLPWDELASKVGDRLIDTSPQKFVDECYPQFRDAPFFVNRTNHNLIDQPSGLCTGHLFCGFHQCVAMPEFSLSEMTVGDAGKIATQGYWHSTFNMTPQQLDEQYNTSLVKNMEDWLDPANANPAYNIPPKVLFPETAGDVVAAVEFCKKHGVEISIKNSGHSYTGASTKANTLLINMNRYKRYSYDDEEMKGVIECSNSVDVDEGMDNGIVNLDEELCRLVQARGKPAAIRVGGGENFDKLYRSVREFNNRTDNPKYVVVGGAAGTVSPMGWTFSGGLAGRTKGRSYGFGVDQVLQIEAVLPNGEHVRFGPTRWEEAPGYLQPKTTKVSGLCNTNPTDNEDNWVWDICPEETDALFDDLWFAFRGGGGGTWGIVLSIYLQLHDYEPFTIVGGTFACADDATLLTMMLEFLLDFYVDPAALGISNEQSSECASANGAGLRFNCYSKDPLKGENIVSLWREFVSKNSGELTDEQAETSRGCFISYGPFVDYGYTETIPAGPHAGKISDGLSPDYSTTREEYPLNLLLPRSWVLDNKEFFIEQYMKIPNGPYWAFGGMAGISHDQTTSLSTAHREAAVMVWEQSDSPYQRLLPEIYNFTTGVIPPYLGANHLANTFYGPLKEDPTKPCPIDDLTRLEAESLCHSAQEAIWGTEVLERLESIKQAVDPDGMLDCFRCVGNSVGKDPTEKSEKKTKKGNKKSKKGKKGKVPK